MAKLTKQKVIVATVLMVGLYVIRSSTLIARQSVDEEQNLDKNVQQNQSETVVQSKTTKKQNLFCTEEKHSKEEWDNIASRKDGANLTLPPGMIHGCPTTVLLLDDMCRMGNQFFLYLQAMEMADRANRTLYIRKAMYIKFRRYFYGPQHPLFDSIEQLEKECGYVFHEMKMNYKSALEHPERPFVKLEPGFPQHISAGFWNTLLSRRPKLLSSSFKWRPELIENVHKYKGDLIGGRNFTTLVGVHVRMQDYLNLLSTYNDHVILPQEKYFNRAMDYFKKNYHVPLFLVVSNDMKWVRENVRGPDVVYAGNGNETNPGWDLAVLASCDHLIFTYGSYGVMAAYLLGDQGEVVSADEFTSNREEFTENLRKSKWPKWKWISVK